MRFYLSIKMCIKLYFKVNIGYILTRLYLLGVNAQAYK